MTLRQVFLPGGGGGEPVPPTGGFDTYRPALHLSNASSGTPAAPLQAPGLNIVQTTITNNGLYGGATQVSSGWTNPGNAVGKRNSSNATVNGSLTSAQGGPLTLTYASLTGKSALVISSVWLYLWGGQSGTVLSNGNYSLEYSLDGGTTWTTLFTNTGNFSNFSTQLTDAIAGDWTRLQNFRVRVTAQYPVGATPQATLDAVELEVNAILTETN